MAIGPNDTPCDNCQSAAAKYAMFDAGREAENRCEFFALVCKSCMHREIKEVGMVAGHIKIDNPTDITKYRPNIRYR